MLALSGCQKTDWSKTYSQAIGELRSGNSDAASSVADSAARQTEHKFPVWHWKFRVLKAETLIRHGSAKEAAALLESAATESPREVVAQAEIVRANALCGANQSEKAVRLLDQAEQVLSEGDQATQARLEIVRGYCAFPTDIDESAVHFTRAATLAKGADSYVEMNGLGALGYVLMKRRRYDQCVDKLTAATAVDKSAWLRQAVLGDLGECYQELGDWPAAIEKSEEAEKLASGMKDGTSDRARWLIDLGREHNSQMQYDEAEKSLLSALAIAKDTSDTDLKARCLVDLAMLSINRGDPRRAESYISQGEELHLQGEPQQYLLLYQAELAELEQKQTEAESLFSSLLSVHPNPQITYEAQRGLARHFVAQKKFGDAEKMFRAGMLTLETAFDQIQDTRFQFSFSDYIPSLYDEYIRFLIDQNRPLDALSIAERGRSRVLASALGFHSSSAGLNLPRIQNNLRQSHRIVLAYWLSQKDSYLWVITPAQMKVLKLPPEMDIKAEIDTYSREVLEVNSAKESRLGQKLYDVLVAPAENLIPKGSQVVVVPHRSLYRLNFETLVSPHPQPHFWIEDVCIQNASFLAMLETPKHVRPTYSKDLLLMGDPIEASKDYPGLEHAHEELLKVAAHFPRSQETVVDRQNATPPAYVSSNPEQFRYFHFVTHGTASDANPLDSAIVLSPSPDGYKLYVRNILKARIHPELVTISACYGQGTRQYSGEGLVGLAWGFMRAGAHEVIAALWEVNDAANGDLMDQFYTELTNGKSEATALRDAKLTLVRSKGHRSRPFYWASLQLQVGP